MLEIKGKVNQDVVERINIFEPEYCYLIGMILINFTDAPNEEFIQSFVDAVSLAEQFKQEKNSLYFKETCHKLHILVEVKQIIRDSKTGIPGNN